MKTEEFIKEVVAGLDLPKIDAEGRPVNWTIDDKDTGKTLDQQRTLDAQGVSAGHHLHMRRQVIAGWSCGQVRRSRLPIQPTAV